MSGTSVERERVDTVRADNRFLSCFNIQTSSREIQREREIERDHVRLLSGLTVESYIIQREREREKRERERERERERDTVRADS